MALKPTGQSVVHPGSNGALLRRSPNAPRAASAASRALQEQLGRAARLQRRLLPDVSLPVGEFVLESLYRPCDTLGGDLYDLTWRGDCAMLLVADVMGHGVEAALITMLAKATFVESASETDAPGALLAAMRGRLHRLMPERVYVAAAVARLPLNGDGIEIANAGLPHPYVLRAAEHRVDELPLDGVPLGLFLDQDLEPTTAAAVTLAPGDVLLVGSDGIGSCESGTGQFFQDAQLVATLERLTGCDGGELLQRLTASAAGFGCGRPACDDVSLIAVSRRIDARFRQGGPQP